MSKLIMMAAATSLAATPALAAPPASTAGLSLAHSAPVRVGASSTHASHAVDGPTTVTAVVFAALIIGGIVAAATSGGDDKPDSP